MLKFKYKNGLPLAPATHQTDDPDSFGGPYPMGLPSFQRVQGQAARRACIQVGMILRSISNASWPGWNETKKHLHPLALIMRITCNAIDNESQLDGKEKAPMPLG